MFPARLGPACQKIRLDDLLATDQELSRVSGIERRWMCRYTMRWKRGLLSENEVVSETETKLE